MNLKTDVSIISRNGFKVLAPFGVLTFLLLLSVGLTLLSFLLLTFFFFLVFIHRNPERISPFSDKSSILAPIDGRVKKINSIEKSPIDGKPGFEVVVESGYLDVAILRAPVDAHMNIDILRRGSMLNSKSALSELNETATIRFSTKHGDIVVKHTLGSWARPLVFSVEGEILQNQRYGFMLNGISSIYLPSNSRVGIKEGMTLRAGESLIGYFSE